MNKAKTQYNYTDVIENVGKQITEANPDSYLGMPIGRTIAETLKIVQDRLHMFVKEWNRMMFSDNINSPMIVFGQMVQRMKQYVEPLIGAKVVNRKEVSEIVFKVIARIFGLNSAESGAAIFNLIPRRFQRQITEMSVLSNSKYYTFGQMNPKYKDWPNFLDLQDPTFWEVVNSTTIFGFLNVDSDPIWADKEKWTLLVAVVIGEPGYAVLDDMNKYSTSSYAKSGEALICMGCKKIVDRKHMYNKCGLSPETVTLYMPHEIPGTPDFLVKYASPDGKFMREAKVNGCESSNLYLIWEREVREHLRLAARDKWTTKKVLKAEDGNALTNLLQEHESSKLLTRAAMIEKRLNAHLAAMKVSKAEDFMKVVNFIMDKDPQYRLKHKISLYVLMAM